MDIRIYQGSDAIETEAKVTVVIDVIRAFTVAHYAFLQGVKEIYLVETVEHAFRMKEKNPDFVLAGEVNGLAIDEFDLDNSPSHIQEEELTGKTLVQKTTNGVRATLNNLSSNHLFVTGFTNARKTAEFIRDNLLPGNNEIVHIIASHPSGDDDYACAEFMKQIMEGDSVLISAHEVIDRIIHAHVAEKFFDEYNTAFNREDIMYCIEELDTNFVMKVDQTSKIPKIERVQL
ncbi:2-phosphosulfolactate phosphatase [Ornithinibacillus sp. L9]|uniref:Probable 2-phosphosulfolactate phosphatase n=1 Tax=Ornithinibacillus caprae TaxID=2678566 RepID=A0A6N8FNJ8_9BACI|nr:2-phosphosulfolactate phosphatase [Ornithinibacillus caprae]MUK90396.1 2-phosphosulfolactate phosphatase [Ornithinibacillus caprae]